LDIVKKLKQKKGEMKQRNLVWYQLPEPRGIAASSRTGSDK